MNFIREKKIFCGDYLEVDIIPKSRSEKIGGGKRNKKKKISAPKQKRLNDKNAKRYFIQLVNTNFNEKDLHVTCSYSEEFIPKSKAEADKMIDNFIKRASYRRKKEGLPPLKYILITEGGNPKKDGGMTRIHHHIIMDGLLDRDIVESLWRVRRKKGEKEGRKIGRINARRLQPDEYGLEAISRYLMKDPQGEKRWSSSQNLDKPWQRDNDHKYSKRKVERLVKNVEDRFYWEDQYKGYWLTESKAVYNDLTGWAIYLKMRKEGG